MNPQISAISRAAISVARRQFLHDCGIGLGKIALLVLSRTYSSGVGHNDRLDAAATTVGMERIHPPAATLPILTPRAIDMTAVSQVFMSVPDGQDPSLLPDGVQFTLSMLTPPDG